MPNVPSTIQTIKKDTERLREALRVLAEAVKRLQEKKK